VNGNCTVPVVVEGGGEGAVAHVGLHALGSFADRLGVGHSLSKSIAWTGERAPVHDRGKVLVQAMLMLAGGGEACTDIEHLRSQTSLFGSVPSDSTLHRTFHQLDAETRAGLWDAIAGVRAEVWSRSSATTGTGDVVLDIDASLHEIHSENKAGTAPHYKGGFGFHPIYCFADATGECLSETLRPGNAGANTITDHVEVLVPLGHHLLALDGLADARQGAALVADRAGSAAGPRAAVAWRGPRALGHGGKRWPSGRGGRRLPPRVPDRRR